MNQDMETEQAWSLESGYQWRIMESLRLKTDLYYMWYENLIGVESRLATSAEGTPSFELLETNTGDAEGYGAELELEYTTGSFVWNIWYAYNGFETEFYRQSIRAFLPAKNKVGVNLRWFLDADWTFNGQYAYTDKVEGDASGNSVESAHNLDLSISRSFLSKKGELMLGASDLFNKEYDPVPGLDQGIEHRVPGRTFFLRGQYTF